MPLTDAEWNKLEGIVVRALLAAQTGKPNSVISKADADALAPSSNSKIYELLAYGDSRLETDTAEPHANSIQRVRFESLKDRAQLAAISAAVTQLAQSQGTPIDMDAIRAEIKQTVEQGLAQLDLRIVAGSPAPTAVTVTDE
jgi:hypothetical protein